MTTKPLGQLMKIKAGARSQAHVARRSSPRHPRCAQMASSETELEMLNRHIRMGARHISRQREIIDRLTELGAPAQQAIELLELFEVTQALHIAHRERLLD